MNTRQFQQALHRSNLLGLIRTEGLISRSDLAKRTGLSRASVTGITANLVEEGLIEEKETGLSEGGRRPILLAIKADGVHVVGVNIAIDQIRVVIINFQAEIKASQTITLDRKYFEPEEIVEMIAHAILGCMWEANFSKDQIAGVGVGIPGLVESGTGTIRFLPNYGWEDVPFRDMLRKQINHPVFIDNSSNNLAIAEHWYGDAKGADNFLVITLENGVGSGVVVNGQLVRGSTGIASEFGHIRSQTDGPLCRCGRRGCLETFVGSNAILRDCQELIKKGEWYSPLSSTDELTFTDVIAELTLGNPALEKIYKKAGEVLGDGIFTLTTMYNPELVIITGKGVQAGPPLFNHMFSTLEQLQSGKYSFGETEIIIQTWTDGDWARESGTLVLREIYKSPFFK